MDLLLIALAVSPLWYTTKFLVGGSELLAVRAEEESVNRWPARR
jgi:hypothetical protein